MSHVTLPSYRADNRYSRGYQATEQNDSCHKCEIVESQWMSRVTLTNHRADNRYPLGYQATEWNDSCHTYERVVSQWISRVTLPSYKADHRYPRGYKATERNESCHMYEWVMSHISMSHVIYERVTHVNLTSYRADHRYPRGYRATERNELCHIYKWVMSYMNESLMSMSPAIRQTIVIHRDTGQQNRMSYVTCMDKSCHIWMSHVIYEWVTHVDLTSHRADNRYPQRYKATERNESCHVYGWVMSYMKESLMSISTAIGQTIVIHRDTKQQNGMSQVTCTNESCHIWMSHVTFEWVMSHLNESCHIWISHSCQSHQPKGRQSLFTGMGMTGDRAAVEVLPLYMNASCHVYSGISHVTYINEACHTGIMSHFWYVEKDTEDWYRVLYIMNHIDGSCRILIVCDSYRNIQRHTEDWCHEFYV